MVEAESMMDKSVFWAVSVYSPMKLRTFPYSVGTVDALSLNVRMDLLMILNTTLLGSVLLAIKGGVPPSS